MPNTQFVMDRLRFLQLDQATAQRLRQARGLLEPLIEPMLDRFYEHILAEPSVQRLFVADGAVERARSAQKRHWLDTLLGGQFDSDYLDKAYRIGRAHARIGLTPNWYIGGYCLMLDQFIDVIAGHDDAPEVIQAVVRAVFLDIDCVIHCYLDVKDETMRDMLLRASRFSQDAADIVGEMTKAAEAFGGRAGNGEPDMADSAQTALRHQVARLAELSEDLTARLERFHSRDRLFVPDPEAPTGTFARLKALFGRDQHD
jgi:hypothetical protein